VGGLDLAPFLAKRLSIAYAIVAMQGQSARRLLRITEKIGGAFPHLLVIPEFTASPAFCSGGFVIVFAPPMPA
jgi:hypothetical protein